MRGIVTVIALSLTLQLSAQSPEVTVSLARKPQNITAFDVSGDGTLLVEGGGSLVLVSNIIDQNPVFSATIPYGTRIDVVRLSPDKTKLAILSSDRLSSERFVTLYDMQKKGLLMSTVLTTIFLPPVGKMQEIGFLETTKLIKNKSEKCVISSFSERFKFTRDRLFLFFANSVAEFYYDGRQKQSELNGLIEQSDFMQPPGFEKVERDTIPHYYALLPWFSTFDSVMARTYHHVVFDPTLNYGLVLYTQKDVSRIEVWNIWKNEKIVNISLEIQYPASLTQAESNSLCLSSDGRTLFYYSADSVSMENLQVYGNVHRINLVEKTVEQLFVFPEPEPVLGLKLSSDGKYLFCYGADYKTNLLDQLIASGGNSAFAREVLAANFWSFDLPANQLKKFPLGNSSISKIDFSSSLNNAFIATEHGFYRVNLYEDVVYAVPTSAAPKVLKIEADEKGYLWVGTDSDIRQFDLTNLRQVDYWPAGKIDQLVFHKDHNKVITSEGKKMREIDLVSGKKTVSYVRANMIGEFAFHLRTGKLVSSEYDDLYANSDSCHLRFGTSGSIGRPIPFSSSYQFEDVSVIVPRKQPIILPGASVRQLALSPDGEYLACKSDAKMSVDPVNILKLFQEAIKSPNDSLGSNMDASMLDTKNPYPGEIKLWKFKDGRWRENKTLSAHKDYVINNNHHYPLCFSNDSKYLAASDKNLNINVWNIATGNIIAACGNEHGDSFTINQLGYFKEHDRLDDFKTDYKISALSFSPNGMYLVSVANDKKLVIWRRFLTKDLSDPIKKNSSNLDEETDGGHKKFSDSITYIHEKTIDISHLSSSVTALSFTNDGRFLLIGGEDGTVIVFNFIYELVQGIILLRKHSDGYIALGPNNMYYANPEGSNLFYFNAGSKSFPSEQFDLYYNRPDQMASFFKMIFWDTYGHDSLIRQRMTTNLKIDSAVLNKRLELYGMNSSELKFKEENLQIELLNESGLLRNQTSASDSITLSIRATAETVPLAGIHIWVNNVPVFGRSGFSIPANTTELEKKITIPLSNGENLIQMASRDLRGKYSLRKSVIVYHRSTKPKPTLYLITLGVDKYNYLTGAKLKYPIKNCRDIRNGFKKGPFGHIEYDSIFNDKLNIQHIAFLKAKLQKSYPDDVVIVFYSGHGKQTSDHNLYLATSNTQTKNWPGTGLSFAALDDLLDSIPARQKLLLIDACESGLRDPSSVKADQSIFLKGLEMFSDLNRGTGTITIASTSGYSSAFEWRQLGGSVFTYLLLQAIRKSVGGNYFPADYDLNGQVTVSELQRYLKLTVPELNRKLSGKMPIKITNQRPGSRTVNLRNDFRIF